MKKKSEFDFFELSRQEQIDEIIDFLSQKMKYDATYDTIKKIGLALVLPDVDVAKLNKIKKEISKQFNINPYSIKHPEDPDSFVLDF